ncbi:hypothetical protein EBBID32_46870 [Sphingobium indicum BiD32]|uniref:Uncharacterized protein n=1 Tax=Sphingobium indicum BiD32 TaxID=1301087 RepID=N1MYK8_9SPHN|nr:hypothetical protein [Sphingobium indicum]CCW20313.1 hypothetical protein EBBID32_46870 [Sphingobium indicum BiD32]
MTRMGTGSEGFAGQRLPVIAALWTLIAITLLSALAPLGPPLSRAAGSAFNPATSDVVIKARAQLAPQAVQTGQPNGDGPSAFHLLLAVVAASLLIFWRPCAVPAFSLLAAIVRSGARSGSRLARAPPACS